MERINKIYVVLGLAIAYCFFFEIAAHADELNDATTMTFNAPVQVPGTVLPAGTYVFKLASNDADVNIVYVFNTRGNKLYASFETIPTLRREATGNTVLTLAEQPGTPDSIVKWFYPGRVTGFEFQYPAQEEKQLKHDEQRTVVTTPTTVSAD